MLAFGAGHRRRAARRRSRVFFRPGCGWDAGAIALAAVSMLLAGADAGMARPDAAPRVPWLALAQASQAHPPALLPGLPGAAVPQRGPLRYPAAALLLRRLRTLDQRVRHHLLRHDVPHVPGGGVERLLRPHLLRLPVPADDLQRSFRRARDAGCANAVTRQFTDGSRPCANGPRAPVLRGAGRGHRCCWPSSSSATSWSRATCCAACSRSTSAPPPASPERPSRWSRSSISPWCASASAPPSAPTAICRACSATATRCWSTIATRTTPASNARSACASAPWGSTSASRRSRSSAYTAPSASMPARKSWRASKSPG